MSLHKIISYLFVGALSILTANAQLSSTFYYKDVYNDKFDNDSLIRMHLPNLTESYFVITTPLIGGTTGVAPEFINIWNKIKHTKYDIVLVCYTNGGLRKKDLPRYLETAFKLSKQDLMKLKIITDDALWAKLSEGKILVRLQYYYRNHLYYDEAEKWHNLNANYLPKEVIKIAQTERVKITGIDSCLLFERDKTFPFKPGHILILADAKNEILDLNVKTGEVIVLLNLKSVFDPVDLYCKYIAKSEEDCNFAKQNQQEYINRNRKLIAVDGVYYIDNKLILSVGIEVAEKQDRQFSFINDEGKKVVTQKGNKSLSLYSFIMHYNLESKSFNIYNVKEIKATKKRDPYIMDMNGLRLKSDTIITTTNSWINNDVNTIGLVQLIPKDSSYYPLEGLSPKDIKSGMASEYYSKNFFYRFCDTDYFSIDVSGNIYVIGRNKPQSVLYGNGTKPFEKEKYITYPQESVVEQINYLIHDIKPVLNNNYILAFYYYKNEPIFELKNRMLKTVDVIDARKIKGLDRYLSSEYRFDILIHEDKIYYKSIENDELYLNVFSITEMSN